VAASQVSIVNRALSALGHKPIVSFDDDSKAARLADRDYDDLRDAVIQAHPWNFAQVREMLAANATAPVWGFERAFDLPSSPYCLRVLSVQNEDPETGTWKVEGRQIVTNFADPLPILYLARVTDVGLTTTLFREALSARIAWDWAESITGSTSKAEAAREWYERKLSEARSIDGQEGTIETLDSGQWVRARFSGSLSGPAPWTDWD